MDPTLVLYYSLTANKPLLACYQEQQEQQKVTAEGV